MLFSGEYLEVCVCERYLQIFEVCAEFVCPNTINITGWTNRTSIC